MRKKSVYVFEIISLLISVFLAAGVNLLFHACIHDDESFGSCHWAQQAVFAFAIALCVMSVIAIVFRDNKAKMAVNACIIVTGIVAALIPKVFIGLCMMPTMHCVAYMHPWTIICSVVIVLVNALGIAINIRMK